MATVIASTAEAATSNAFAMSGEGKMIATLVGDEYAKLLEEHPDGVYRDAINDKGIGILITAQQPSRIFVGYGNYKVYKTATAEAQAVNVES